MTMAKTEEAYVRLRRLLLGYELNGPRLSAILNVNPNTARRRLAMPGDFTLSELDTISKKAGVPYDEIMDAVRR